MQDLQKRMGKKQHRLTNKPNPVQYTSKHCGVTVTFQVTAERLIGETLPKMRVRIPPVLLHYTTHGRKDMQTEERGSEQRWATADKYAGGFMLCEYTGETARYCGRSMVWRQQPIIPPDDVFKTEEEALAAWESNK